MDRGYTNVLVLPSAGHVTFRIYLATHGTPIPTEESKLNKVRIVLGSGKGPKEWIKFVVGKRAEERNAHRRAQRDLIGRTMMHWTSPTPSFDLFNSVGRVCHRISFRSLLPDPKQKRSTRQNTTKPENHERKRSEGKKNVSVCLLRISVRSQRRKGTSHQRVQDDRIDVGRG